MSSWSCEHWSVKSGLLRLGSVPVWTVYLPVMAMVQGVSCHISHGLQHQSVLNITCTIAWLIPRIDVLGWVITRIAVLGFAYFRKELESPCQLYINLSTEDQVPQLDLLEPSPLSFCTRESSLSVTFESLLLQSKVGSPLVTSVSDYPTSRVCPCPGAYRQSPVESSWVL